MAITVAVITKNVCMSKRWQADQVAYGIHNHPSPSFTHREPLKLGFHFNLQSVQSQFTTVT
jgi:hypothetical protein